MSVPKAYVTHQTDHRLRVRIPNRRRSKTYFSRLEQALEKCEQVEGVRTNPETGSALIFHSGNVRELWDFAGRQELFELGVRPAAGKPSLATLEAGVVAGLGIYQLLRGRALPPAWTLFGQALSLLRQDSAKRR